MRNISYLTRYQSACEQLSVELTSVECTANKQSYGFWTRQTTHIHAHGAGFIGTGEDVCYEAIEHRHLMHYQSQIIDCAKFAGRWKLLDLLDLIANFKLFFQTPRRPINSNYRNFAFESAILDLALRQNNLRLDQCLDLHSEPLHFVASMRLPVSDPMQPLRRMRELDPEVRFKLDFDKSWTPALVRQLRDFGGVEVVDIKGCNTVKMRQTQPDHDLLAAIIDELDDTIIEDPWPDEATMTMLKPLANRVSWDAPIKCSADIERFDVIGGVNLKPSRVGSIAELFRCYDLARRLGLKIYFGGQSELGRGRKQVQRLAAILCPESHNDCAPKEWNLRPLPADLATSPIELDPQIGFG